MPLEVVVELQIRAISCPGVFLPGKQDVYLGVYLLNQYLKTDNFPSVFPIMIQRSMMFEKVFENAIDPGAVADILESFLTRFELIQLVPPVWEELAYYEENTRDFLFPEPKLTPHPGMCREVLMKTAEGFPVDSAKPFGENSSKHHSQKSRRKSNFSNFPFPMRRASSLDSLAANVKDESPVRVKLHLPPPSTPELPALFWTSPFSEKGQRQAPISLLQECLVVWQE
ncbi:Spermatogenesis associated 6-like protein [Camelus dromedarius]|uniref:Spermatogenesis associated 6-like protein n=1 Tax=Camelus dromedarius TaxID=9838 RepID=A0A5N4EAZ0_CAMDR|nr:Spermatogenesis associated 6-like protein [Camelus dromedarius]